MGVYIDSQDKSVFPFFEYDCVTSPCCVIESCRTCFHSTGAPSLALPWRLPLRQAPRMMRGLPRCLSSPPPPSCSISTPRRWTSVHDCSPDSRCTIYVLCSRSGYVYMQVSRSSVMFCRSSTTQLSCRGGSRAKFAEVIPLLLYSCKAQPRDPLTGRPTNVTRKSMETRCDPAELKNACTLINTADYCQTTALEVSVIHFTGTHGTHILSHAAGGEHPREVRRSLQGEDHTARRA